MKNVLFTSLLISLSGLAGADVIVNGGSSWMNTTAAALYDASPASYNQAQTTAANTLNTVASANYNGVHNNTAYDFAVTGSAGYLQVGFDHASEAIAGQYGEPHNQAQISFTVTDAPVDYFLSGSFAGDFTWTTYNVQLAAGKSSLFNSTQTTSSGNADFALGAAGSGFSGNLTGTLGIGTYTFIYNITDQSALSAAGSSNGFVRLDFGAPPPPPTPTEAVPEPSTWACMGLGLAGLLFARRRRA